MGLWSSIKKVGKSVWSGVKSVGSALGGLVGGTTAIGGALAGIPGSLISGAINLGGKWLGNQLVNKPNADDAYAQSQAASAYAFDRSQDLYKKRYQYTVKDMRKAGLNPILAASGGFNVGSSPQMSAPQAFLPHQYDSNFTSSAKDVAETDLARQKAQESFAAAVKQTAETRKTMQEIKNLRQAEKTMKAEERKLYDEALRLVSEIEKNAVQIQKIGREIELTDTNIQLGIEKVEYTKKQAATLEAKLAELRKFANVWNGPSGQMMANVKAVLDAMNLNFAAIIGGLK